MGIPVFLSSFDAHESVFGQASPPFFRGQRKPHIYTKNGIFHCFEYGGNFTDIGYGSTALEAQLMMMNNRHTVSFDRSREQARQQWASMS